MNVSELARRVRVNSAEELLEILPDFGFDVGKRAIKIDDKIAGQIIKTWPKIKKELEFRQRKIEEEKKERQRELRKQSSATVVLPPVVSVKDFAALIDAPVSDVIKILMSNGIMATLNERIDFDTASLVADEFGANVALGEGEGDKGISQADKLKAHFEGDKKVIERAPVIVIMGHVDHGKTKLLDTIREANVVDGESGGITQHIGAYQVEHNEHKITFIDTPGHEAFTAMRSRGAKVADIAILVVAADDSIKPQTKEAIKIIKAAGIPMIVAINKIDKPDADIERVKADLAKENLTPEEWGGNTIIQEISAKENINIDKLLDTIVLVTEMEQAKIVANPNRNAAGTIIESHVEKSQGPVATVLVQSGTLRVGDQMMINDVYFGKVRSMIKYNLEEIDEAGPSVPVKILGLKFAPRVGDLMEIPEGKISRAAKKVTAHDVHKEESVVTSKGKRKSEGDDDERVVEVLKVIVKADTLGSLEVIIESLEKLSSDKAKVKLLTKGLGNITDNDITLAADENAMVVGFHVKPLASANQLAIERDVDIKKYEVIYNLIDDVQDRLKALIKPEYEKKELGRLEVLAIFAKDTKTMVFGGKVLSGKIVNGTKVDILRNGTLYESGVISNLQSGKQDVREVVEGQECGISYKGSHDVEVGDIVMSYEEIEKKS
jgi:translation initiation factor IF-2